MREATLSKANEFSGLQNGTFTIYSSDHCPFRYDHPNGKPSGVLEHEPSMEGEKHSHGDELQDLLERKNGSFKLIPNGIPGVETRLPLLYTGALATGRITPQKFVELTSTNPAKLVCYMVFRPRQLVMATDFSSMGYIPPKGLLCLDPMQILSSYVSPLCPA